MTVCFHVIKNRVCSSSAVEAGTVQTMSALSVCFFPSICRFTALFPSSLLRFPSKTCQNCQHFGSGMLVFFLPLPPKAAKKAKLWMLWRKGSVSLKRTWTLHEGFERITVKQWNPLEMPPFFPLVTLSLPHLGSWNYRWRKTCYGAIVYHFFFLMGQSL